LVQRCGTGSGTVRSAENKKIGPSSAAESQLVENPSSVAVEHEIDQFNTSAVRPSLFDMIRDIHFEAVKNKLQSVVDTYSLVYVYKDK
jgi:hypothetical protein